MWRDSFNFGDWRVKALLFAVLLGLVYAIVGGEHGRGVDGEAWVLWMIIFVALPVIFGRRSRRYRRHGREYDDGYDRDTFEKPKREPRYVMGDDGELIEVGEDQPSIEDDDADKTMHI